MFTNKKTSELDRRVSVIERAIEGSNYEEQLSRGLDLPAKTVYMAKMQSPYVGVKAKIRLLQARLESQCTIIQLLLDHLGLEYVESHRDYVDKPARLKKVKE